VPVNRSATIIKHSKLNVPYPPVNVDICHSIHEIFFLACFTIVTAEFPRKEAQGWDVLVAELDVNLLELGIYVILTWV
jgi:hypothetical protein